MAVVVVLGAGVCGLATALLLHRDGHAVTVLERDPAPVPDSPDEAWERWRRAGVGQFRQAHYLLPRGSGILGAELPDVREALLAAGAVSFDSLTQAPPTVTVPDRRTGDEAFVTVTGRRPPLEQVVARLAEEEPGLRVERGVEVAGPVARRFGGVVHVTGVRTTGGREVAADLVLDVTGRRSPLPRWLHGLGGPPLHEEAANAGFTYYTRFFRSRGGGLPEVRDRLNVAYGTFSILTLPGDGGTWSVTLFASSRDRPLKELRHEAVWTSVVAACPTQAHWLDGEPITGVLPMGGVLNRYRRLVVDGTPVVTGLLPVADAWASTNPSVGRGITLGLLHALVLRDVLRASADEPRRLMAAWDAATEGTLTPWYRATVGSDEARLAEMDALRAALEPPPPAGLETLGAMFARAMAFDAELFRGYMEVVGCLALPGEVLSRPGFADRVQRVAAEHPPSPRPGPDREQLLRLVGGTPVG